VLRPGPMQWEKQMTRILRWTRDDRGQAMAEFGLVLPLFILLVVGLIEFALAFNANLAINFASREATLVAAESGNESIADCRILKTIEDSVDNPADAARIGQVRIYRADINGTELAANVYARGGNITCTFWDGIEDQEITVNYTLLQENYPAASRCNQLQGCGGDPLDTIGVAISYSHAWATPIAGLVTLSGDGFDFTISNAMRMEPIL
jgi:Flp pilus assembly protein TadG